MKKLLIVLGIILVLAGILFYVQYMQMSRTVQPVFVPQVQTQETKKEADEIVLDKEKQIGNMVFGYGKFGEINNLKENSLELNINIKSSALDTNTMQKVQKKYTPIYFSVFKNTSPKNLTTEEWLDKNAPYKDKQSPYSPISVKDISIDGEKAISLISYVSPDFSGDLYNIQSIYIFYGDMVYKIDSYVLPVEQVDSKFKLTDEEIKNIQAYEKIVEAIIQSIRFVK